MMTATGILIAAGVRGKNRSDVWALRWKRYLKRDECGCLFGDWLSTWWACQPGSGSGGGEAVYLRALFGSKNHRRCKSDHVVSISKQKNSRVISLFGELCRLTTMFTNSRSLEQIVFVPPEIVYLSLESVCFHDMLRRTRMGSESW